MDMVSQEAFYECRRLIFGVTQKFKELLQPQFLVKSFKYFFIKKRDGLAFWTFAFLDVICEMGRS